MRSIKGFETAHITRPGYAIEYDFFEPRDLKPSLESKLIENLFLAGQINGTTGYEEAAGQGIIAGINAALKAQGRPPFILLRSAAYIGVIGSRRRWATTRKEMMEKGVPAGLLDRVHSPIGLELNAETPEEIAVSIMAEIIKLRSQ